MGWGPWTRHRSWRRLQGPCACSPLLGRSRCGIRSRSSAAPGQVSTGLCAWWRLGIAPQVAQAGGACASGPLQNRSRCGVRLRSSATPAWVSKGLCFWCISPVGIAQQLAQDVSQGGPDCSSKYGALPPVLTHCLETASLAPCRLVFTGGATSTGGSRGQHGALDTLQRQWTCTVSPRAACRGLRQALPCTNKICAPL